MNTRHTERFIVGVIRTQNWWAVAGIAAFVADRDRRDAWTRSNAVLGAAWVAAKRVSRTVRRPRPNLGGRSQRGSGQ
jgi:hypothetical protein